MSERRPLLIGCAGLYAAALLLGFVACAVWRRACAADRAELTRLDRLRLKDVREADVARARLLARAGLERALVEVGLRRAAGDDLPRELVGDLGATYSMGSDGYVATLEPDGERLAVRVVGEVRVRDWRGSGDEAVELASCVLTARVRLDSLRVEDERYEDTSPPPRAAGFEY